jgi:hypothetical protein
MISITFFSILIFSPRYSGRGLMMAYSPLAVVMVAAYSYVHSVPSSAQVMNVWWFTNTERSSNEETGF